MLLPTLLFGPFPNESGLFLRYQITAMTTTTIKMPMTSSLIQFLITMDNHPIKQTTKNKFAATCRVIVILLAKYIHRKPEYFFLFPCAEVDDVDDADEDG